MKNRILWLLVLGMAFFVGCSDDDNDLFKNYSANYSADKLDLKLNGKSFPGATVSFNAADKSNAKLTLNGVIPGESALEISNLIIAELENDNFSFIGENKNDDRTITVEGAVKSGVLNLGTTFKVTSKVVGEWQLAPVVEDDGGAPISSGLYLNVVPESDTSTIMGSKVSFMIPMISNIGGQMLPLMLTKIEFKDNGSLVATYLENMDELFTGQGNYVQSPEELVRYNVKDGQIYISVDIASLIGDAVAAQQGRSEMGIEDIMNMVVTGLPLKMNLEENKMRAYVDQQMMLPFMPLIRDMLIPMLQEDAEMAGLIPLLYDVIRLVEKSKTIELGLDLVPYVEIDQVTPAAYSLTRDVDNFMQKYVK